MAADGPLTHASPLTHTTAACPSLVHRPRVSQGMAAPRPARGGGGMSGGFQLG